MSKTDFTPVKGGHYDGRTFKTHVLRGQSLTSLAFLLGIGITVAAIPSQFEGEMYWYYGVISFFSLSIYFVWWKLFVIKHWNTLKANGIRTERILQEQKDKNK
jgi:hypothetical protein